METLDSLNRYSSENFESWLEKQLRQIYLGTPEEKYHACDFRYLGISRSESHIDALQGLFKKLSDNAREQFKKALEQILRHVKPDDFPNEAMADIITLIGLTDAYSVFPAFIPVLGCGPWGEIQPALIYDALSVLMMFDRSEEAYESVKRLATSLYFPNALVFDAYLVMVRSRPENWRDDFALLRNRFSKVIEEINSSADMGTLEQLHKRQHSLAQLLPEAVPLFELGRQLANLKLTPTISSPIAPDGWLIDNLFQFNGAVYLRWDEYDDTMTIYDRLEPTRKAKVETTSAFEVVCISRRLISIDDQFCQYLDSTLPSKESQSRLENVLSTKKRGWLSSFPANQKAVYEH